MSLTDYLKWLLLSAIWGGSFLFMRIAAPEFGPFFLIWLRVAIASVLLSPFLFRPKIRSELRANPGKLLLVGIFNAALPWCLLAYAILSLEAGFTSLLNAATPIFAAVLGFLWLREPLTRWQIIGLFIGLAGVIVLVSNRFSLENNSATLAILATLAATLSYSFISHFIKRHMSGISARAITVGNLMAATIILTPLMIMNFPENVPGTKAILCAIGLGVLSTALAFVLLFDILAKAGATATTTVTFVIPVFGILFGTLFLDEQVTLRMITGMLIAFTGAALTTKLLPRKLKI